MLGVLPGWHTNVVTDRGASSVLPWVVPMGARLSAEMSDVRYMAHDAAFRPPRAMPNGLAVSA